VFGGGGEDAAGTTGGEDAAGTTGGEDAAATLRRSAIDYNRIVPAQDDRLWMNAPRNNESS